MTSRHSGDDMSFLPMVSTWGFKSDGAAVTSHGDEKHRNIITYIGIDNCYVAKSSRGNNCSFEIIVASIGILWGRAARSKSPIRFLCSGVVFKMN